MVLINVGSSFCFSKICSNVILFLFGGGDGSHLLFFHAWYQQLEDGWNQCIYDSYTSTFAHDLCIYDLLGCPRKLVYQWWTDQWVVTTYLYMGYSLGWHHPLIRSPLILTSNGASEALKQPATKASTEESDADLWTLDAAKRRISVWLLRWNDEPRWWGEVFVIFIPIWELIIDPIWLIFFRWVETTNQCTIIILNSCNMLPCYASAFCKFFMMNHYLQGNISLYTTYIVYNIYILYIIMIWSILRKQHLRFSFPSLSVGFMNSADLSSTCSEIIPSNCWRQEIVLPRFIQSLAIG